VESELRSRRDDPLNDHRLDQIAHPLVDAGAALQRSFEPELADHGLHRSHMAVRQTANNLEAGFCCAFARDLAAIEQRLDAVDQRLRQLRQIGQRAFLDAPALAITLAQ
jgi:hypothetical protein